MNIAVALLLLGARWALAGDGGARADVTGHPQGDSPATGDRGASGGETSIPAGMDREEAWSVKIELTALARGEMKAA